jgi:hypothetical protein
MLGHKLSYGRLHGRLYVSINAECGQSQLPTFFVIRTRSVQMTTLNPSKLTVRLADVGDCGEIWLSWIHAFDNQTPQATLQYWIYVNGVFDHTMIGDDQSIVYGNIGSNTVTIIAKDSTGNAAAPVNATVSLCQ